MQAKQFKGVYEPLIAYYNSSMKYATGEGQYSVTTGGQYCITKHKFLRKRYRYMLVSSCRPKMLGIMRLILYLMNIAFLSEYLFSDEYFESDKITFNMGSGINELLPICIGAPSEILGGFQIYEPEGISIDENENIYICDPGNKRILVYNQSGNYIRTIGNSNDPNFNNIALPFVKNDKIYFVNRNDRCVYIYNKNTGEYIRKIGELGTEVGKFTQIQRIFVDNNERVFIGDASCRKIEIYDENGNFVQIFNNVHSSFFVKGNNIYYYEPYNQDVIGYLKILCSDIYTKQLVKQYLIQIPTPYLSVELLDVNNIEYFAIRILIESQDYFPSRQTLVWYKEHGNQLMNVNEKIISKICDPDKDGFDNDNFAVGEIILKKNGDILAEIISCPISTVEGPMGVNVGFSSYYRKVRIYQKIKSIIPSWSPDSTKIIFETNIGGNWNVVGAGLAEALKVTSDGNSRSGSWHPYGNKVVYVSNKMNSNNWDIYVRDIQLQTGGGVGGEVQVTYSVEDETSPCFSPKGDKILYGAKPVQGSGNWHIYEIDYPIPAGTSPTVRQITSNHFDEINCRYSPDGKEIAYSAKDSATGQWDIYVKRLESGTERNLTQNLSSSNELYPCWSPDGDKIAFCSNKVTAGNPNGDWKIYTRKASDGSNEIQVTSEDGNQRMPDWSRNGRKIAYSSDQTYFEEIWVKNADGTGYALQVTK